MNERYRHLKRAGSHGTFLISCESHSCSPFLLCSSTSDHSLATWNPSPLPPSLRSPEPTASPTGCSSQHWWQGCGGGWGGWGAMSCEPLKALSKQPHPEDVHPLTLGSRLKTTLTGSSRKCSGSQELPLLGWPQPIPTNWPSLGTACNFPGSCFLQLKEEIVGLKSLSEIFQAYN